MKIVAQTMEQQTIHESYPWMVRFKRLENTNGNVYMSTPVFRDRVATNIVHDWLLENGCYRHCFLDRESVLFANETDALLCYTYFR